MRKKNTYLPLYSMMYNIFLQNPIGCPFNVYSRAFQATGIVNQELINIRLPLNNRNYNFFYNLF